MIVHKYVDSAEAAAALPVALHKLRTMQLIQYPCSKRFMYDDVEVTLRHMPFNNTQQAILIGPGTPKYEFFNTDIVTWDANGIYTPPYAGGMYVLGNGVSVFSSASGIKARMRGSSSGLNKEKVTETLDAAQKLYYKGCYNNTKFTFRQQYTTTPPIEGGKSVLDSVLYTTVGTDGRIDIAPPYYVHNLCGLFGYNGAGVGTFDYGDVGWDIRQRVYYKGKSYKNITVDIPAPRWWRRGTTVSVEGVPISIVTDSFNNFYFFKTDLVPTPEDITQWVQYTTHGLMYMVPTSKCIVISWSSIKPAWAAVTDDTTLISSTSGIHGTMDVGGTRATTYSIATGSYTPQVGKPGDYWGSSAPEHATQQLTQATWNFHPDGNKVVGIVGYDRGNRYIQDFTLTLATGQLETAQYTPIEIAYFARYAAKGGLGNIVPAAVASGYAGGYGLTPLKLITPALLEFNISITIGSGGELNVSMWESYHNKDEWVIAADYAYNLPALQAKGITRGQLLYATIQGYKYFDSSALSYDKAALPLDAYYVYTVRFRSTSTIHLERAFNNVHQVLAKQKLIETNMNNGGYTARYGAKSPYANICLVGVYDPGTISAFGAQSVFAKGGYNQAGSLLSICRAEVGSVNFSFDGTSGFQFNAFISACGRNPLSTDGGTDDDRLSFVASITALDLRSLSVTFESFRRPDGTVLNQIIGTTIYVNGDLYHEDTTCETTLLYRQAYWTDGNKPTIFPTKASIDGSLGLPWIADSGSSTDIDIAKADGGFGQDAEVYRYIYIDQLAIMHESLWRSSTDVRESHMATHPNGSWAMNLDSAFGSYDKIVIMKETETGLVEQTTTHLDMFNSAFNSTRSHTEYGTPSRTYKYGAVAYSGGWI